MRSVKVHRVVGFKQKKKLSEEIFWNIILIQTYDWTNYALCESTVTGGLQAEAMARIRNFFKNLYTFKHTIEQIMRSVKVHWVMGLKQKQWLAEEVFWNIIHMQTYNWTKYALCESTPSGGLQAEAMAFRRSFSKHFTHSNIHLNKVCALWKYSDWWDSTRSNGSHKKLFKTLYTFKHTIDQSMRSVKVHWLVGFNQKQLLSEEVFQNIIHIQTYNWTKYALCESPVSGGLQAEARASRRSFQNIIHIQTYNWKKCALFQSNKVTWVVGFKQKQGLSEEVFWNIINMQT